MDISAAGAGPTKITLPADDQILMTREFAAPPRLVFRAWTEPDLVRRWWSGGHGELTTCEIDLRVGGTWRYVIAAEHGEVAFHGEFREIVAGERIVTTEVYEMPGVPEPAADAVPLDIVTFADRPGGGTALSFLVQCPSRELRDTILESGMETGARAQMDLLEELTLTLAEG